MKIRKNLLLQERSRFCPDTQPVNSQQLSDCQSQRFLTPRTTHSKKNRFTTANYAHVGQKWSFTAQFGDVLLNHVADTYRMAIESQQETMQENPLERMM